MKGSITVFFSMVMVVIISVLTMTIESARLACARLYLKQAVAYSLESVFADYYVPLFKDYGLLLLDVTYGEEESVVLEKYEKYLSYNINPNKGSLKKDSFFYAAAAAAAEVKNIELEKIIYAVEGSGEIVRRQAYEYMKYKLPADFAESFLSQFDYILQAEALQEFFEKIERIQGRLESLDRVIIKISNCVDTIKEYQAKISELGEKLSGGVDLTKEELEDIKELFNIEREGLLDTVLEIEDSIGTYESLTDSVREYIIKLGDEWLSDMEVPEFVRDIIKDEIEALLMYSGGEGDIYGIEDNKSLILKLKALLEEDVSEEGITAETMAELLDIEITINLEQDISGSFMGVDFEELLDTLSDAGIYGLICPDYLTLSEKTIDPFYNRNYAELVGSLTELPKGTFIDDVAENICFAEYVVLMFSDYCNQEKDRPLAYEAEYIIGGFYNEKDNINATIKELIGVREVLNLLYLMCDSAKKEQVHTVALSLTGAGGGVAVKVTQYLIMAVWALGEALLDVRVLMSGGNIPVIKASEDWRLDLQEITDIFNIIGTIDTSHNPAEVNIGDWEYSDYLKLVLFMNTKDELAFRIMDLIEEDIQNKYYSEFYFNNCAYCIEVAGDFYLEPLFGDMAAKILSKTSLSSKYSY